MGTCPGSSMTCWAISGAEASCSEVSRRLTMSCAPGVRGMSSLYVTVPRTEAFGSLPDGTTAVTVAVGFAAGLLLQAAVANSSASTAMAARKAVLREPCIVSPLSGKLGLRRTALRRPLTYLDTVCARMVPIGRNAAGVDCGWAGAQRSCCRSNIGRSGKFGGGLAPWRSPPPRWGARI